MTASEKRDFDELRKDIQETKVTVNVIASQCPPCNVRLSNVEKELYGEVGDMTNGFKGRLTQLEYKMRQGERMRNFILISVGSAITLVVGLIAPVLQVLAEKLF